MPDEIVTTPPVDSETPTAPTEPTVPSEPTLPAPNETPAVPSAPPASETEDPSSEKEAEAVSSEPDVHVDPSSLGDGNEAPSAAAKEASEELPAPPADLPASEDPHSANVDTGSDAPLSESAPKEDEAPKAPEWEAPYQDTFPDAQGVVEILGADRVDDLKTAANNVFHVCESLIDKDLSELDGGSAAILGNVRNHAAGFLAAVEAIFKRTR